MLRRRATESRCPERRLRDGSRSPDGFNFSDVRNERRGTDSWQAEELGKTSYDRSSHPLCRLMTVLLTAVPTLRILIALLARLIARLLVTAHSLVALRLALAAGILL